MIGLLICVGLPLCIGLAIASFTKGRRLKALQDKLEAEARYRGSIPPPLP